MNPPQGPARRPQRPPAPAYRPTSGGPLDLDPGRYEQIATAPGD
jgi:hypothetical protein